MTMKAQTKPLTDVLPGGGPAGCTVAVEPFNGGEGQTPPVMLETTKHGRMTQLRRSASVCRNPVEWVPFPAYVIHHPKAGPVLVDTALHLGLGQASANLGRAMAWAINFRFPDGDLSTQLRARDIDPEEHPHRRHHRPGLRPYLRHGRVPERDLRDRQERVGGRPRR